MIVSEAQAAGFLGSGGHDLMITETSFSQRVRSGLERLRGQPMPRSDFIAAQGTVIELQGHGFYLVRLDDSEHEILARMSGRMSKNHIRVIQLDRVELEISPADWSQARIVYRYK